MPKSAVLSVLLVLLGFCACQTTPPPARIALDPAKLTAIDTAINNAIAEKKTPGAVFWLERQEARYRQAYGRRALMPAPEPNGAETIYDAASLTKVLATTPAILLLIERGQVQLDAPVKTYLPEFSEQGKEGITVRHLLTHTSGLRPGLGAQPSWTGYDRAIELACAEKPQNAPGTVFRYSDINFIVLGEVVRRVSGSPLHEFAAREIYGPLKMMDTGFLPPASKWPRIAPTEPAEGAMLRGVVHDPTSRRMGGVAGHAGLFTTAADVARYARMMLNLGTLDGVRVFRPETVKLMTSVQSPTAVEARRGLGWDIDSGYSRPRGQHFPLGSYGHTGWTGTCLWIDPFSRTFWVFLSNRNHPDGNGNVLPLYGTLGTLAAEAVMGFDFQNVAGALPPRPSAAATAAPAPVSSHPTASTSVLNGIDVLARQKFAPLRGLRVGLITNHTGQDRQRRSTIDLLRQAPGVQLKALFSPEHGIRGDRDESIGDSVDGPTGLPVYSLYGETRRPKPEQLKDLDALVFDIQDIGCRFYTYISTLGHALEAARQASLKIFVLDRVNPINGVTLDGPVLGGPGGAFTAYHAIPLRHGMTVGELARMFNEERGLQADLTVIPVAGWSRSQWFDETGLPWTQPSPNMRSLTEAALYPGVGLLETTALSVGRGTDTPFEVVGAPYIDDVKLAAELNRLGLRGVRFVPVRFTPSASVFKGQSCGGVNVILLDREQCEVVDIGISIARVLQRMYPKEFNLDKFNNLLQDRATLEAIRSGQSVAEIRQGWAAELAKFKARREKFLLYR